MRDYTDIKGNPDYLFADIGLSRAPLTSGAYAGLPVIRSWLDDNFAFFENHKATSDEARTLRYVLAELAELIGSDDGARLDAQKVAVRYALSQWAKSSIADLREIASELLVEHE